MTINPQEYVELESILKTEISRFCSLLPTEDLEAAEHYLNHAEIEMSFESLGLSLVQNRVHPNPETAKILLNLGKRLNLEKESVFDDEFWINFTNFLQID